MQWTFALCVVFWVAPTVNSSLTVGEGQAAASETAPDMQTTVIRGTFDRGGWSGDPSIGAKVYWDNTIKEWLYLDEDNTDAIFENMECAVTQIEREALLDIYNSAGGAEGKWQDQWQPDDYPCPCIFSWHGVKCDRYGAVKELNLAYNGLVGSLPASMQNLQSLTLLAVNSNDLTGPFPEINATSLEVLYIHNTYFTSIPNSIAYLPRLDTYFSQTFDTDDDTLADILDRRGLSEESDESDMDHEELCRKQPGKHRHISCDPIEEVRAKERVFGEKLLEP
eukprot:CAMPEP_0195512290 /NCGR_PEP_ID=MMETSP0794_2-20130614/4298_1 /TAXON_ID=515487 /ORGANISM="Stephanopyxis turris, Strain CCMP 815" /LENGTH=279 /DNA_ID=CAMNT_0040640033 /DNA_START=121 /DNA_END=960 /DNA_ORIENTATION=-